MKPYIPYEKLSKKKKKELDSAKRGSWHGVNPITRRVESKKVYRRKKALKWKDDLPFQGFCFLQTKPRSRCYTCFAVQSSVFSKKTMTAPGSPNEASILTQSSDRIRRPGPNTTAWSLTFDWI